MLGSLVFDGVVDLELFLLVAEAGFDFFGDFFVAGGVLVLLTLAEDPGLRFTAVLRSTVFFSPPIRLRVPMVLLLL